VTSRLQLAAVGPAAEVPEAILWADEPALRAVIDTLRSIRENTWVADLSEPPIEGPGTPLARIAISPSGETVHVDISGDELRISGSRANLAQLADYLALYANHNDLTEPGMHTHLCDHPTLDWVAPDTALEIAGWWPELR